jgi:tetratricopeptide (TPR) repeat protein
MRSQFGPAEQAGEKALAHARRADDRHEEARTADGLCTSLLYGPAPALEAIERCEQMLDWARGSRVMEANIGISLAGLRAMRGEFDEARTLAATARSTYEELGLRLAIAGLTQIAGHVEMLAGDLDAAEREFRQGFQILEPVGSTGYQAALLAEILYQRGELAESARFVDIAEAQAADDNVWFAAQVIWRGVRAKLQRNEGLAREAARLSERTDSLNLRADALVSLAETLQLAALPDEAAEALRGAIELYERKGNVVAVSRAAAHSSSTVR